MKSILEMKSGDKLSLTTNRHNSSGFKKCDIVTFNKWVTPNNELQYFWVKEYPKHIFLPLDVIYEET